MIRALSTTPAVSARVLQRKPNQAFSRRTFVSFRGSKSSSNGSNSNNSFHHSRHRDPGLGCTSVISNPAEIDGPEGLPSRTEQVRRLQSNEEYDVLIIGGGITGSGCALDAATRGLKVACIERGDFASETSSRSTKLVWAGIKYLATAVVAVMSKNLFTDPSSTLRSFYTEMKMVWHCHQERRYMTEKQGHLVNWVPIVLPFTEWHISPPPFRHAVFGFFPIFAPLALKFYDGMSQFKCPPSYILTKTKAKEVFPQLDTTNIKYCAVFFEAQHNDSRTNLAVAMSAAQHGAHIVNYVEMTDMITEGDSKKVVGVHAVDRMTGQTFTIRAKKVVFCGGPFTDELRQMEHESVDGQGKMQQAVRGAHGTHIVLPGKYCPQDIGLLDYWTTDGRFLFFLPWEGHTLIGTTDSKTTAETLPTPPEEEVSWLLKEGARYLNIDLPREDVLSAWRGWRPLVADPHAPPDAPVSRDHVISENPESGVVFIAGGKWTTWRQMAQEVLDRVVGKEGPKCNTLDVTLFGGGDGYTETLPKELKQKYPDLADDVATNLVRTYGVRAWEVLKVSSQHSRIHPDYPYIDAEIIYGCREYACTIEDMLSRRTRLAYLNRDAALNAIPHVANLMAKELGWSGAVKEKQIQAAEQYIECYGGPTTNLNEDLIAA